MRGYDEVKGHATRMDFDAETGQFFSQPVAHAFSLRSGLDVVARKLMKMRVQGQRKKAERRLLAVLAKLSPQQLDDIGMTYQVGSIHKTSLHRPMPTLCMDVASRESP